MIQNRHWYKTFFVAGLSLAILCGCTKSQIDEAPPQADKLYFNATLDGQAPVGQALHRSATRAYAADIDFAARGFTVAGYRTQGVFSTIDPNNLPFPNVFDYLDPGAFPAVIDIKKNTGETNPNRQYSTDLPRLTLSNLYNLSFFAFSTSLDGSITSATRLASDKGAPWLWAKVGAVSTPQPDIVGAVSLNHTNEYTISAVDLDFKHLLSKMSFSIRASNDIKATITDIECVYAPSSVFSEGKFTFDGTSNIGSWGELKTYLSGAVATGWNKPALTTTAVSLGNMVFVPQKLKRADISLNIKYTIAQAGGTSHEVVRNVPLEAVGLQQGKNYVYTLAVYSDQIEALNVKVEDWIDMPGVDGDLPIVPGEMDPNVLLLLEGTDAPYVTTDGRQFWLDRSGWNHHCQIMDRMQYDGPNAFDITYDPQQRGYVIPGYGSSYNDDLSNHIKIPDLGATLNGNVSYEVICQQTLGYNRDPHPFILTNDIVDYGSYANQCMTFAPDIAYNTNHMMVCYGAQKGSSDHDMNKIGVGTYDWTRRAFYFGSRNTITAKNTAGYNNTNFAEAGIDIGFNDDKYITGGYIGAQFSGTINYIKILKKSSTFDDFMHDFGAVARRYNVTAVRGPNAPDIDGLLACWDARSGLVQGAADGNGAYWMDQSGNGYYLKAQVPQGASPTASIKYNKSKEAIEFAGPKYVNPSSPPGVAMINPFSMGKTRVLTFELVYKGDGRDLSYGLQFLNKKGGATSVTCRPFTGDYGLGFELCQNPNLDDASNRRLAFLYHERISLAAAARQHAVGIIDFDNKAITLYINGMKLAPPADPGQNYVTASADDIMELGYTILGNHKGLNQAFHGDIHAFRIYNRALTIAEIQANYAKDKIAFSLP